MDEWRLTDRVWAHSSGGRRLDAVAVVVSAAWLFGVLFAFGQPLAAVSGALLLPLTLLMCWPWPTDVYADRDGLSVVSGLRQRRHAWSECLSFAEDTSGLRIEWRDGAVLVYRQYRGYVSFRRRVLEAVDPLVASADWSPGLGRDIEAWLGVEPGCGLYQPGRGRWRFWLRVLLGVLAAFPFRLPEAHSVYWALPSNGDSLGARRAQDGVRGNHR